MDVRRGYFTGKESITEPDGARFANGLAFISILGPFRTAMSERAGSARSWCLVELRLNNSGYVRTTIDLNFFVYANHLFRLFPSSPSWHDLI